MLTPSFLLNPPAWSLFFELLTNFGHALSLRWLGERALMVVIGLSALAVVLIQAATGVTAFGDVGWAMFLGLPRVVVTYAIGVLIFRRWRDGRLPRMRAPVLILPIVFFACTEVPTRLVSLTVTGDLAVFAIFPAMMIAAVQVQPNGTLLRMAQLGAQLSYPLYMVHVPLIMAAEIGIQRHFWTAGRGYAVAVMLAFVTAALTELYFDRPIRLALAGRTSKARRAPQQDAAPSAGPA